MFRSFFPAPKLFFASAIAWLLFATLLWTFAGDSIRNFASLDRLYMPPTCAITEPLATETDPQGAEGAAQAAPETADVQAPATSDTAVTQTVTTDENCISAEAFFTGERMWLYQYVLMIAVIFCAFWYVYQRNKWYWWSVVGTVGILLVIYFNVQVDAFINNWQGTFFTTMQTALSTPGSVAPEDFYSQIVLMLAVIMPNILVLVILAFFTSHYVFRWRKAMNEYYMTYWPAIRKTEGAAQRVQEDTMRFAAIIEDLGTAFFSSLITLVVFLPILWNLSQYVSELPILGNISGSLVWVALISAIFGTVLLGLVGIKLPGLNYENQLVEAAYRKELVYGEDHADRADPPTVKQLFANVQRNYFRMYFHYTYFNIARYGYINIAGYIPLLALSPTILAGGLTLGIYQQVLQAFGQVSGSFQFLARAWTTIVELLSVHKRLRHFESNIPNDHVIEKI